MTEITHEILEREESLRRGEGERVNGSEVPIKISPDVFSLLYERLANTNITNPIEEKEGNWVRENTPDRITKNILKDPEVGLNWDNFELWRESFNTNSQSTTTSGGPTSTSIPKNYHPTPTPRTTSPYETLIDYSDDPLSTSNTFESTRPTSQPEPGRPETIPVPPEMTSPSPGLKGSSLATDFLIQFCRHTPTGNCQEFTITKFRQNSDYRPWYCILHRVEKPKPTPEGLPQSPKLPKFFPEPRPVYEVPPPQPPMTNTTPAPQPTPEAATTPLEPSPVTKPKKSDNLSLFSMGDSSTSQWSKVPDLKPNKLKPKLPKPNPNHPNPNGNSTGSSSQLNGSIETIPKFVPNPPPHIPDRILKPRIRGILYVYSIKSPFTPNGVTKQYFKIGTKMDIKSSYFKELVKCPVVRRIKGNGQLVPMTAFNPYHSDHLALLLYLIRHELNQHHFSPSPITAAACPHCQSSHDDWYYLSQDCIRHLQSNSSYSPTDTHPGWPFINKIIGTYHRQINATPP